LLGGEPRNAVVEDKKKKEPIKEAPKKDNYKKEQQVLKEKQE
jgi:hypothetical protein